MKVTTEVPLKLQRFGETPRVLIDGREGGVAVCVAVGRWIRASP